MVLVIGGSGSRPRCPRNGVRCSCRPNPVLLTQRRAPLHLPTIPGRSTCASTTSSSAQRVDRVSLLEGERRANRGCPGRVAGRRWKAERAGGGAHRRVGSDIDGHALRILISRLPCDPSASANLTMGCSWSGYRWVSLPLSDWKRSTGCNARVFGCCYRCPHLRESSKGCRISCAASSMSLWPHSAAR